MIYWLSHGSDWNLWTMPGDYLPCTVPWAKMYTPVIHTHVRQPPAYNYVVWAICAHHCKQCTWNLEKYLRLETMVHTFFGKPLEEESNHKGKLKWYIIFIIWTFLISLFYKFTTPLFLFQDYMQDDDAMIRAALEASLQTKWLPCLWYKTFMP